MFKQRFMIGLILLMLSVSLPGNMNEIDKENFGQQKKTFMQHVFKPHKRFIRQKPILEAEVSGFSKLDGTQFYLVKINLRKKQMSFERITGDAVKIDQAKDYLFISWDSEFEALITGKKYDALNYDILKYVDILKGDFTNVGKFLAIPGHPPYKYSFLLQKKGIGSEKIMTEYYLTNDFYTDSHRNQPIDKNTSIHQIAIMAAWDIFGDYCSFERFDASLNFNTIYYFFAVILAIIIEYLVLLALLKPMGEVSTKERRDMLFYCCLSGVILALTSSMFVIPLLVASTASRLIFSAVLGLVIRSSLLIHYLELTIMQAILLACACIMASFAAGFFLYALVVMNF